VNSGQFANHARKYKCDILPSGTARVIRLYNPKTQGRFNIAIYDEVYPDTIRKACTRLGIPFPPGY